MFCTQCGAKIEDGAKFCTECGAKVTDVKPDAKPAKSRKKKTAAAADVNVERVTLCPDGKYRWVYEYPMLRNPVLFFSMLKIFCLCALAPALVTFIADIGSEGVVEAFLSTAKVYLLVAAIMAVLTFIGYLIVAASYGWKYVVVFIMDENGIEHMQQQKQFKKAQVIGIVTALAGAHSGNLGRVGQGTLVAANGSLYSNFSVVKKVKGYPHSGVIKVNSLFSKNQIYMPDEDYDFVWEYITSRCPKAKIS